jgi:hypothetical protein
LIIDRKKLCVIQGQKTAGLIASGQKTAKAPSNVAKEEATHKEARRNDEEPASSVPELTRSNGIQLKDRFS